MYGKIHLRQPDGSLKAMIECPFDREDILQKLLEDYPDLLAGDQMNPEAPRRWVLVGREMGVPDDSGAANRWSLDHLFLDQEGVPTLVEVKRSSDTRIRREVVGQMLDYAANAVVYWPVHELRSNWERTCEANNIRPEEAIRILQDSQEAGIEQVERFWEVVKTNLQAGHIRLVFLADIIPSELKRVIEFLNGQMDPAEVIAVEVRQFVGEGLQSLVSRVIGQTAMAQKRKAIGSGPTRQWDEATFMEELLKQQGETAVSVAQNLLAWLRPRAKRLWWGKGMQNGSFVAVIGSQTGQEGVPLTIWTSGTVELGFQHLCKHPAFSLDANRIALLDQLRAIPGVELPAGSQNRRPNFGLAMLLPPTAMADFKKVMESAFLRIEGVRTA